MRPSSPSQKPLRQPPRTISLSSDLRSAVRMFDAKSSVASAVGFIDAFKNTKHNFVRGAADGVYHYLKPGGVRRSGIAFKRSNAAFVAFPKAFAAAAANHLAVIRSSICRSHVRCEIVGRVCRWFY